MFLTKASRYGLYALVQMARAPGSRVKVGDVAASFEISENHVAKVLQQLARAGLVTSARGASGGYELIVVDYVFEHARHVERFLQWAPSGVPVHLFTLRASLEVIRNREAERPGRERLGERVSQCYETMRVNLNRLGHVTETDGICPALLVENMRAAMGGELGRSVTAQPRDHPHRRSRSRRDD